jgi:hypothetical protein
MSGPMDDDVSIDELREALREGGDIKAEIEEVGREGLFYNSFLA